MTKKMTKKEWYEVLKEVVNKSNIENKAEAIAFIEHEAELLRRKTSAEKATKTQKENIEIMKRIKEVLKEIGKPVTISEMQDFSPEMASYNNQKLSALLRKMGTEVGTGEVIRTVEKKKAYFSLA